MPVKSGRGGVEIQIHLCLKPCARWELVVSVMPQQLYCWAGAPQSTHVFPNSHSLHMGAEDFFKIKYIFALPRITSVNHKFFSRNSLKFCSTAYVGLNYMRKIPRAWGLSVCQNFPNGKLASAICSHCPSLPNQQNFNEYLVNLAVYEEELMPLPRVQAQYAVLRILLEFKMSGTCVLPSKLDR